MDSTRRSLVFGSLFMGVAAVAGAACKGSKVLLIRDYEHELKDIDPVAFIEDSLRSQIPELYSIVSSQIASGKIESVQWKKKSSKAVRSIITFKDQAAYDEYVKQFSAYKKFPEFKDFRVVSRQVKCA
ncbi:MAG: hypothetical protein ACLGGX_12265 [Bdellovibrionia bacterium]